MQAKDIEKALQEEQWTRAQIGTFTLGSFQQLDEMVTGLDDDTQNEVKSFCDKFLGENPKSVVALYVSGSIALVRHSQEDNINLLNLIEMFVDIKKWNIVEFLCQKILSVSQNRHALRLLASSYEQQGNEEKMFEVYEKLIKADHDEIDIVKQLAERAKSKGDNAKALEFYKIAFERTLNRHDITSLRALFDAILPLCPGDFEYLVGAADKVSLQSPAIGIAVLRDIESHSKNDVEKRILCEKKVLNLDKEDLLAKQNLVESYKSKYKDHSRLNTCLEESSLLANYTRDVLHAIEDFEKNISFDKGTFVYQESTKRLGRIRSIDDHGVVVDFVHQIGKDGTLMSPAMAFRSLRALPKSHILVLKGCVNHEKLAQKILSDVSWALNILFVSNDGSCSMKQMKKELYPDILTDSQWTTWSRAAKEILMNDVHYDVSPDDDSFILRTTPVTYEEKQLAIFNSHEKFYDKVKDLKKFLGDKGNADSESFYAMIQYFSKILEARKDQTVADAETMGSYLLLDDLLNRKKFTFIKIPQGVGFGSLTQNADADKLVMLFKGIEDPDLKKCFIDWIVETKPDWDSQLIHFFPYYLTSYIPDIYRSKKKAAEFEKMYALAVNEFRDYSNMLIYLIKNTPAKTWDKAGITQEKLLFTDLEVVDFLNHKIDAKVDGQESSANAKILMDMLFGKKRSKGSESDPGLVFSSLKAGNEEFARKIDSLVQSCFNLDPGLKIYVRHIIQERYPDMTFNDAPKEIDKANVIPTGWFCSPSALETKKKELDNIQHVILPKVATDIAVAREKGDLRENSEYKYSKEQQQFYNTRAQSLKEEIDKAIVVTKDKIDPSRTSFGTEVVIADNKSGKDITYTLMGPWDSDPDKNIINILAPMGNALLNKSKGERFAFDLNGQSYDYTIKEISVFDFS
jgi:transcription elongation factor GreA